MGYVYIALTILFTVYGQLILKWQVNLAGAPPEDVSGRLSYVVALLLNPWVLTGLASAFVASLAWMGAMTKFPLSHAYPFMSINFALVLVFAGLFFQEPISISKVIGIALIAVGIAVGSQG